ncbi:MAG: acyl-CoA dehydrogenase [Gammaproteobacteria bacterium]|nr:acyl-CoA dehydrogenase [Gammaproteobacteria bacterium]
MSKETDLFCWEDPFLLEDQLSEEEKEVRDTARRFSQEFLAPRANVFFREEHFDPIVLREMGKAGLLGATIKGYGCAGVNYVSYGLIAREVESVDSGFRSALSVQSSLVMLPIFLYGSEQQKQTYLPKLAAGEWIGCFCLTEADHGSDPASMETRAKKGKNAYLLSGSKMWITNAPLADVFIVWAKNEEGRIRGFILEKGMKGLTTSLIKNKWSLRASATGEVVLDEVEVPFDRMLPLAEGLRAPLACLDNARYGIAWGALGAADFCWKQARNYVLERKQFGRPLAAMQLVQEKLVDMQTQINLALQAVLRVGRMKDRQLASTSLISLIKRNSSKIALDVAREARDLLGANGITEEYQIMRHMMNLETVKTYEGTLNIHTLILGLAQTGIQAFKPL